MQHMKNCLNLTIKRRSILMLNCRAFSEKKKISEIGFKTEDIIDATKMTYFPAEKMTLEDGRYLVYESKKGFLVSFRRYLPYFSSISALGYLVFNNPFLAVFPASAPILCIIWLISIKLTLKRYEWNKNIVHQIKIFESGSTSEIVFADAKRRNLFGEPLTVNYYNSIFSDPNQREKEDIMPNSNPFPLNVQQLQKQKGYSGVWCKYFSNGENYLIIPKDYKYIKEDVMVELLKGKTIRNV